jgi:hypothetical protein
MFVQAFLRSALHLFNFYGFRLNKIIFFSMHNNIINKKRLLTIIINQIRCLQQEYQSKGLLRSKGSSAQNVLAHKIYEHLAMHDYLLEKKHIKFV